MATDQLRIKFCVSCNDELMWEAVRCSRCGAMQTSAEQLTAVSPQDSRTMPRGAVEPLPASPNPVPTPGVAQSAPLEEFRDCPECAETIKAAARSCRFCGFDLVRSRRRQRSGPRDHRAHSVPAVVRVAKSGGLAAMLSFLYPGIGQMYAGFVGRGLAIIFGPALAIFFYWLAMLGALNHSEGAAQGMGVGLLLLILVYVVFWFWQILDASRCAEQMNRNMQRPGPSQARGVRSRRVRRPRRRRY